MIWYCWWHSKIDKFFTCCIQCCITSIITALHGQFPPTGPVKIFVVLQLYAGIAKNTSCHWVKKPPDKNTRWLIYFTVHRSSRINLYYDVFLNLISYLLVYIWLATYLIMFYELWRGWERISTWACAPNEKILANTNKIIISTILLSLCALLPWPECPYTVTHVLVFSKSPVFSLYAT